MDFASNGYDLIFGHGFQFMEPIIKVAEQFPNVNFALGTGRITSYNVCYTKLLRLHSDLDKFHRCRQYRADRYPRSYSLDH